jgi:hypothetical protein
VNLRDLFCGLGGAVEDHDVGDVAVVGSVGSNIGSIPDSDVASAMILLDTETHIIHQLGAKTAIKLRKWRK